MARLGRGDDCPEGISMCDPLPPLTGNFALTAFDIERLGLVSRSGTRQPKWDNKVAATPTSRISGMRVGAGSPVRRSLM